MIGYEIIAYGFHPIGTKVQAERQTETARFSYFIFASIHDVTVHDVN